MRIGLLTALFAAFLVALPAFAYDLSENDGKNYPGATITKITPLGLGFLCDGKSGWLDFRDATPSVQKDFGYDKQKAEDFEKKLADGQGFVSQNAAAPAVQQTQEAFVAQQPEPDLSEFPADAQPLAQPPAGATVVDYSGGVPANIDYAPYVAGPAYCSNTYVHWGARYYPAYYWHHWWWNHHWVWHNGHYVPWPYYHHHGVWENGKYYPYRHGRLYGSETWRKEDENCEKFKRQYHQEHDGEPHENFGGDHYHGGGRR